MANRTSLIGFIVLLALMIVQVGTARAAQPADTPPDGTIVSVTETTDGNGTVTGYEVVVTDSNGVDQTVNMTIQEAIDAGLVQDNGDGTYTILGTAGDTIVGGVLQAQTPVADPCAVPEGSNPVDSALTGFFCGGTALGTDTIAGLHEAGYGYGLIAQACFMAEDLGTTCGAVLLAKSDKNFSSLGVPDDVNNWGRLRKYVLGDKVKSLTNLGAIKSGRATPSVGATPTPLVAPLSSTTGMWNGHGLGKGHDKGNHGGNGKGHGKKP